MKKMNSMAILLSACLVFSGCGMNKIQPKGGNDWCRVELPWEH